jgi:hypothetical protein
MTATSKSRVVCREIEPRDLDALASLMSKAFKSRQLELKKLLLLSQRDTPAGLPRFGYLIESEALPVGALLMISSTDGPGGSGEIRCSVSNWYVEPEYHAYASLLVSRALKNRDVTYINASARPKIWPILTAQGFKRISTGVFFSIPGLSVRRSRTRLVRIRSSFDLPPGLTSAEQASLVDHARAGCFSLVCVMPDGPHPFIIGRRNLLNDRIPAAHLIYARSIDDFVDMAGPVGRYLVLRGIGIVLVYSNSAVPGLVGHYFEGRMPKFFKGTNAPRLGDLSYTNIALFNSPQHIELMQPN